MGSTYALVAIGFNIIFNASGILNFAQGEFSMLASLLAVSFILLAGWPMVFGIVLALLITACIGVAFHYLLIRPLRGRTGPAIIVSIGAAILLSGLAGILWGKDRYYVLPPLAPSTPIRFLGATIVPQHLAVLSLMFLSLLGLELFFRRTLVGRAIRACAVNPDLAHMVGIPVMRMTMYAFALSAALSGLAGILIAPLSSVHYGIGPTLTLKGFAATILGGVGSTLGAVAGGLTLGLLESLAAGFLPSGYKDGVAFAVILLMLFVQRRGGDGGH